MNRLIILTCIFALTACAPKRKLIVKEDYPNPFEFELIDTLTGNKDEIYVKAHEWISKTYGSAKTVIDMQDKQAGKLVGKALTTVTISSQSIYGRLAHEDEVTYIMTIDVKDGRYRCVISHFNHKGNSYTSGSTLYPGKSYGDLNNEKVEYKSPSTGKPVEDMAYYDVKNQIQFYCKTVLRDLKTKMHEKDKDF